MKEPYSTVTNIAYLITAFFVGWWALSFSLILLWISSSGYHWTKNRTWQSADVMSMYLVFGCVLALYTHPLVALISVPFAVFERKIRIEYGIGLFALAISIALILTQPLWFNLTALSIGAVSLAIQFNSRIEGSRLYRDKLHSVWHVTTAVLVGFLG